MTWREKLVARILLLVARLVCDDPAIRDEIKHLSNHIGVHAPEPVEEPAAA
jgi:hypothetical protein